MTQTDSRLQDYLDERLSPQQREAFEARMRADSDLARRVASAREVRRALQEDAPALSPGFYTRARARFEQEQRGSTRRGWRVLSWESAGLAAAVGLAAVLFAPHLLRDDGVLQEAGLESNPIAIQTPAPAAGPPGLTAAKEEQDADAKDSLVRGPVPIADAPEAVMRPEPLEPARDRVVPLATAEELVDALKKRQRQDAGGKGDYAPVPPPSMPTGELGAGRAAAGLEGAGAPAMADHVERETSRAVAEKAMISDDEAFRRAGESTTPSAPRSEAVVESRNRAAVAYAAAAEAEAEMKTRARDPRSSITLPPEFMHDGDLRVVEEMSAWAELFRSPGGTALIELGRPDRDRLVLIAPRSPAIDCGRLTVVYVDGHHEIRIPPGQPDLSRGGGCALIVRNDGAPVRLTPGAPR